MPPDKSTSSPRTRLNNHKKVPIVVFAQVPPPEHGQSRMVMLALDALRNKNEEFDVHHINAKFSNSLEDIGESSLGKILLTPKYLVRAILVRLKTRDPILYYVPGPVKWSAVLRDWVLLSVLRLLYSRVVFHWHAIGHGEWAHGSERLILTGPKWIDGIARYLSRIVLSEPFASIVVSSTSQRDAISVGSKLTQVVSNGIEDPCPDFATRLDEIRARREALESASAPCFRLLFLSHGTEEKGTLDALDCLGATLETSDPSWRFELTFVGGVSDSIRSRFDALSSSLLTSWPQRCVITEKGYLKGTSKNECYASHDIFIAPSRWESFGLTVVEAMSHGLQIVAAASDGVAGVLPEDHPYLSPVGHPGKMSENLLKCCQALRDPTRQTGGTQLRQRFLANYQLSGFARNLTDLFLSFGSIQPSSGRISESFNWHRSEEKPINLRVYLADQNPGHDRSIGISRMSQVVITALQKTGVVRVDTITSRTSQQPPINITRRLLPWGTRNKLIRLLTDHFHPLFQTGDDDPHIYYFPKGYLPWLCHFTKPSAVTIHDTIIQYDEDHYPQWRKSKDYAYWAWMLKHTLRNADLILTVSESSREQILKFMARHQIPFKDIKVTYEPCLYETLPQPVAPVKKEYVIHLASREPHKRTAQLVRWWLDAEKEGQELPTLHLVGSLPDEVKGLLSTSRTLVKRPFLEDAALREAYASARALILPSEIEGFGLPALEAYYLGTPVCHVDGTSVGEILGVATIKGRFTLESRASLFVALAEVMSMTSDEVYQCGLALRDAYASEKVASKMLLAFSTLES